MNPTLDALVDVLKQTKMNSCERAGGPDDLMPMLHYATDHGEIAVLMPDGTLSLEPALAMLKAQHGAPTMVAVLCDAHMKHAAFENFDEDLYERGELAKMYAAGDMSVTEALTITRATREGIECSLVRYTYDERGMPVWGEEMRPEEEFSAGLIPEVLTTVTFDE